MQSTHHQGGQALAKTDRLSLAALVTPVAWSIAIMHTALARSEFASCRTRRVRATVFRRVHRLCCPVLQKHIMCSLLLSLLGGIRPCLGSPWITKQATPDQLPRPRRILIFQRPHILRQT